MSRINFTDKSVSELRKNIYIKNISNKSITYTNEFKIHFIAEYNNGKTPRQIFSESGFDIDIIGTKR
ncbi:MAG: HTH domain-containing protein, partial [Paraclostridium sp.]